MTFTDVTNECLKLPHCLELLRVRQKDALLKLHFGVAIQHIQSMKTYFLYGVNGYNL